MTLRDKARSNGLSRMVIWPVSPRSMSAPARRLRSGVGSARCSTRTRSRSRSLLDFANSRLPALLFVYVQVHVAKLAHGPPQAGALNASRRWSEGPDRARAVRGAIGFAVERRRSAKEEARGRGIPHRPAAGAAIQLQQRPPLRLRHIGIEQGIIDI